MKKINESKFSKLPMADKIAIAKHPLNRYNLNSTRAQCDQHAKLSDYDDAQFVNLAEAHYILGGHLVQPNPEPQQAPVHQMNLTDHEVAVARVILVNIFNVSGQRVHRLSDNEFVWCSLDISPRAALAEALQHGWFTAPADGMNGVTLNHKEYPGAIMCIGFDEDGPRESLVIIRK